MFVAFSLREELLYFVILEVRLFLVGYFHFVNKSLLLRDKLFD